MKFLKTTLLIVTGLLLVAGIVTPGQTSGNWVRFESAARDLSISMPDGYLVHTESDKYADRKTIYAFENGVSMVFSAADVSDAVGNLSRVKPDADREPAIMNFRMGGFDGKYITYQKPEFQITIFLARKSTSFRIEVSTVDKDASEVVRFLRSIVIGGQRLATGDSADAAVSDKVSMKDLRTSGAISDVLDKQAEKYAGKMSFEPLAGFRGCEKVLPARPAIVIGRYGGTIIQTIPGIDVQVVNVPGGTGQQAIDALNADTTRGNPELRSLARTLHKRRNDILAYFTHPHSSNGPTEAINGRLEHLRGIALGFRNLQNYIHRSLLHTGGFKNNLQPLL